MIKFDEIIFHDTCIYAWGITPQDFKLLLDVDWIMREKLENEECVFELAPSVFVFENVWDIKMDIEMNVDLVIDDIDILSTSIPKNKDYLPSQSLEYLVRINCMEGLLQFRTIGMEIYQKKDKVKCMRTNLSMEDRGGLSLLCYGEKYDVLF